MATFPTLTPSSRIFTPGEYPNSIYTTLAGSESRVRNSNVMSASRLELTFIRLAEADMLSIKSHYAGQYGGFLAFAIPSALLSGVTTAADFTLTGYLWRYISSPQITDYCDSLHDVKVTLESVAPEGVVALGASLTVSATLTR
jgi:hypothetical protein